MSDFLKKIKEYFLRHNDIILPFESEKKLKPLISDESKPEPEPEPIFDEIKFDHDKFAKLCSRYIENNIAESFKINEYVKILKRILEYDIQDRYSIILAVYYMNRYYDSVYCVGDRNEDIFTVFLVLAAKYSMDVPFNNKSYIRLSGVDNLNVLELWFLEKMNFNLSINLEHFNIFAKQFI
jgi:hypothetical protein